MAHSKDIVERILKLARQAAVVSAREVRELGIHPEYLRRLCADGRLVCAGRRLYMLPDAEVTAHHSLAVAAKAVPRGVVCLLSALSFHHIGTQVPHEVWLAIDRRSAAPREGQSVLEFLFTSAVRVRVLSAVLLKPEQRFYVWELARSVGVSEGSLHRELTVLSPPWRVLKRLAGRDGRSSRTHSRGKTCRDHGRLDIRQAVA